MLEFFSDLIGDNDPNTDFIEYVEKSKDFYVETVINGHLPYHNTTIMVRVFESRSKKQPINARCKWFRVVDSRNYEIRDNPIDDTYHINAYDIGSFLKVAVKAKGIKEVTIIKIGPILLNPKMIPSLENTLLSNEGVFNFALLKYGDKFVDDKSEFQNFIKFSQEKIMVKFGFYFQHEYPDFELNLNGPFDYKIYCENHDPKAISIFFVKGTECMLSENIVIPSPIKKKKYQKLEKEFRERANNQMNPAGVELFDKSEEEIAENEIVRESDHQSRYIAQPNEEFFGNEFEFRIRFTSRLNRDAFICAVRVISIMKTMALSPLIDHTERVFNGVWKMPNVGEQSNEYNKLVGQMYDMGGAIHRVLDMNKVIRQDNNNLVKCAELLEQKLNKSILDFQKILKNIRDKATPEELERMERVNRSMMDTSMRAKQVKDGEKDAKKKMMSNTGNAQNKANGLKREIESTNKLNSILLKEINKLKKDGGSAKSNFKKNKNLGNATVVVGMQEEKEERLNLSGMGKKEGEKYLIGLEEQIEDKIIKETRINKNPKNEEEMMLYDAIGNLEQKKSQKEIVENRLEKSNVKEEDQEDDKLGTIVELELERDMLQSNLKTKTKKFEDLANIASHLVEGKQLSESSVEGTNLDVERIFDSNLSITKLKNLQTAILIKYAESEINQLKLLQEKYGVKNEVDFETFQPQQQNLPSQQNNNQMEEAAREQFLHDIEDLEESNRTLEKNNKVSRTKMENLRKEVEKLQQEVIDNMGDFEEEDEEDIEIRELEKRILELEQRKKQLLPVA